MTSGLLLDRREEEKEEVSSRVGVIESWVDERNLTRREILVARVCLIPCAAEDSLFRGRPLASSEACFVSIDCLLTDLSSHTHPLIRRIEEAMASGLAMTAQKGPVFSLMEPEAVNFDATWR